MSISYAAPRSVFSAHMICLASMVVWAAGLPAADLLIPILPPLVLTAMRNLSAAAFLLPLWLLTEGWRPMRHARWDKGIAVGGVCVGLGAVLLVIAQARTDAVTVAIVSATMPVVGIALEVLLDGRRMRLQMILGLALGLIGGLLAYGVGRGGLQIGVGALAAFGSVLAFTWGSRATVKAFPDLTSIGRTALTVAGASIAMSVVALAYTAWAGTVIDWSAMGAPQWGALALFGVGSLGISQVLWIIAVGRLGIGIASMHMNAVPFYVMVIMFALGAGWNWLQAFAACIVVIGVLIAQGQKANI